MSSNSRTVDNSIHNGNGHHNETILEKFIEHCWWVLSLLIIDN